MVCVRSPIVGECRTILRDDDVSRRQGNVVGAARTGYVRVSNGERDLCAWNGVSRSTDPRGVSDACRFIEPDETCVNAVNGVGGGSDRVG